MNKFISEDNLINLFSKKYGEEPPSREKWFEFYNEDVVFKDPTQEKYGLEAYINAQEKLINRCDDFFLETHSFAINQKVGFLEWTLGLRILNKEFIYPGPTRLIFDEYGKIKEHRDYFDFCGPTFKPIPILGGFIKWLYNRFIA